MAIINVKSMSEIINNFRSLNSGDLVARAEKPHFYAGNRGFAVEGESTDPDGANATVEFRVLDVQQVAAGLYRVTYRGQFFELANGYRCSELKVFAETPRLCVVLQLTELQHHGLMEHIKFH